MFSERIKAAQAVAKLRGQKPWLQLASKAERLRLSRLGIAARKKAAAERAEAYRLHIEWALRKPGFYGRPISFHRAANALNERDIESPMGGRWGGCQLQRMARRLRLNHPLATSLAPDTARLRVQALWKQHPEWTGKQVVAGLGLSRQRLLGVRRTWRLLRECRLAAAKRSPVYKNVSRVDRWTAKRIRISAICTRHPEYTPTQVLKVLGPQHRETRRFIRKIRDDCWQAQGRRGPSPSKGWTPARRKLQAKLCRQFRPWGRTDGPRTAERKTRSAKK